MIEQRSPEWFEARKKRVTGSNVGAILGLSPFATRADVMRSMVRDALGAPSEFTGNAATQWGEQNEDGARFEFEIETGLKVDKAGFYTHEDWLGASPDGFLGEGGLWECKCPYGIRKDVNPDFKSINDSLHYYAQIQIQLFVTNRAHCYFYQWTPNGTKTEVVELDKKWLNENLPILKQFYAEFLHELDHNADDHLKPRRVVVDTPQAHKAMAEWDELREQIELLEERKKDLLAEIVKMAKDNDAEIAGRKLTKVEKAGSVSYAKVVKEKLPELSLERWRSKPTFYWKIS